MFTIDMSSPFRSGGQLGLGGPNSGGHQPPSWYIQYGMDLGVPEGTEVFAAFDGTITRFNPHQRRGDTSKVYGAQLFVRHENNKMGGFYTHITDVGPDIRQGQSVRRGDRIGRIMRNHLHLALVEIIGGAPKGRYMGVDLYRHFLALPGLGEMGLQVSFNEDGSPPDVVYQMAELTITA